VTDSDVPPSNGYIRNWISIAGLCLMAASFLGGLFIFVQELLYGQSSPYAGFLYLAYTMAVGAGFVLVPAGMVWERNRRRRGLPRSQVFSTISFDLTNPVHRLRALGLLFGGLLVVVVVGVGSYRSFHATESIEFCGQLCHEAMNPEWVRYNESPHARVRCAECHIGEGADWFVKSKLSGLRQIWAVAVDNFSRPIPTPIHDLRPARETCEQCHWRRKFTGYKELVRSYYLSDEENTLHQLRMLVKIGGEGTTFLKGSGIHYHMLIANKVEYIATDERRQEIAWVRVSRGDGSVTEFNNADNRLSPEERANHEVRTMDCMDCHNRPAHRFPTPMHSVNEALSEGTISLELPTIKARAVEAIDRDYASSEEATRMIASHLRNFYRKEYPEIFERKNADLIRSILKVQEIYKKTVFPEMKAMWSAYPDNIGHRDAPGCFRCHNDLMESASEGSIFTDCTRCHLILAQGEEINEVNVNIERGLVFTHPEDYEDIDEYTECVECHTGGAETYE
jgi:nitrate/TMAO reductase-like tetraheme cytochrome c subunit